MTTKEHHKHPPLARPKKGHYHKTEFALYGTTCSDVQALSQRIEGYIHPYRMLYVDADHHVEEYMTILQIGKKIFTTHEPAEWNAYHDQMHLPDTDIVIVNGNHYPASKQIVILDQKKKESLQRRVDQLTDVAAIVKKDDIPIYDFLSDKITSTTPIYMMSDFEAICAMIRQEVKASTPPVKALILAGGKSSRMQRDKSEIHYHGDEQQVHMARLCQKAGLEVHISKGHNYECSDIDGYPVIKDRLIEMGPFGGIVSALMHDPDAAWLVLACDLPFVDQKLIQSLLESRESSRFATACIRSGSQFPEPLMAIYEPRIYREMLTFLAHGYACPRKVLINSDIKHYVLPNDTIATNANTPEERKQVENLLKNGRSKI